MIGAIASRAKRALGIGLLAGVLSSHTATAEVYIWVTDASLVKYQLAGGSVNFRNLNDFSSSALGCCYNYWIDTSNQNGRNMFAAFLAAAAQGKPFAFGVPDGYAAGVVTQAGQW